MVESNINGDGIVRNIIYAQWRDDKPAEKGYSKELVGVKLDRKYWDKIEDQPPLREGCYTFLDYFEKHCQERRDDSYLGTRAKLNDKEFGDYEWLSYGQLETITQQLARGMGHLGLVTETEGDGKKWKFVGIWSKNRWEWLATHIANMYYNQTTIGFFDSMGVASVEFILLQTELSCIFSTKDYINTIISMKKDNMASTIKFLVCFDKVTPDDVEKCRAVGVKLYDFSTVLEAGEKEYKPWEKCSQDDCPIFSYTSGTTGDSKGVKLSHKNILASCYTIIPYAELNREESCISYLPYPHSFEQVLTFYSIVVGSKIGYYSGDPAKLTDDCALLRPALFPSVPRLFNRIYSKIKERLDGLTGCSGWVAQRGLRVKLDALRTQAAYTNGCYDKLVFRKVAGLLGGNVRYMITGSAPIDHNVLELLRVCFCCPFMEGYGLTETSGGSSVTWPIDPVVGHVGGPLPCVKWRLQDVPEMQYFSTDKPYPRGELQMKGNSVTSGYYKRPDKTAEAFDNDGWFKTGDVALVYPNGSAKIIDRSKNIFKLSQGEYIAPEKIENIFTLSQYIAQSMLYGDSLRSCTVAIIIPHMNKVKQWAEQNTQDTQDLEKVLQDPEFKKFIMLDINQLKTANKMTSLEVPKDIYITSDGFTMENNLLTPTFKLKRNIAREYYKTQIDEMYAKLAAQGF